MGCYAPATYKKGTNEKSAVLSLFADNISSHLQKGTNEKSAMEMPLLRSTITSWIVQIKYCSNNKFKFYECSKQTNKPL